MIIAWSLLVFVGYNVLTVEATEKDDKKVCESYGGKWKETMMADGSGRSSGERWCNIDNEIDQQRYIIRPGNSLDGTGSDAELGREDLGPELTARIEDELCDDEDADTTDIKECMSGARQQQLEHNYDKKSCEDANGDWNKKKGSGCTFYEDEQQDILDAAEEQRKIIDEEEQEALAAIDEYNALQAQAQQEEVSEDWGNTVTPDTNNDNEITPEEAESYVASTSDEEEEVADNNEEDDNQVNTETDDSSDNTDSSDSQDSSDSEDNSSDDGGDSSDSGDDSSSSDDGGDSGESSESEE